jgi:hypothetical protein
LMTFEWCCFISHRLAKGTLAVGILADFREALANELELQLDEKVYVSEGELKAGDFLDPALEQALCRSACMVLLFTGKYFSKTHLYCAREFLAMKKLEESRLMELNVTGGKEHGLIIPVVLRDLDHLPKQLRKRMWCDFQEFQQAEEGIAKPKAYFEEIRKLGAYIAARCRELSAIPEDDDACRSFHFPDDDEVRQFILELSEAR